LARIQANGRIVNTITKGSEVHPFTTSNELFAIARKITGVEITHVYRDGLTLVGYDGTPILYVIGTSREPVMFLGSPASQGAQQK
jgi:hypothetical protein